MIDKTREVYKETGHNLTELNPFVDMPKMRVDEVNRLNEIIDKAKPKAIWEYECRDGKKIPCCPRCEHPIVRTWNYCIDCGQRLDTDNIAF